MVDKLKPIFKKKLGLAVTVLGSSMLGAILSVYYTNQGSNPHIALWILAVGLLIIGVLNTE